MDVFDRRGNKTCDYVLLRSEQVVMYFSGTVFTGTEYASSLWGPP